jgi:mono/diheme cytochrome c family protein
MRRALLLAVTLSLALAGCGGGGDDGDGDATRAGTVTAARTRPSASTAQLAAGQRAVTAAGCLACHQIAGQGQSGPGSNLDGIGDRMPPSAIGRSLVNSPAPMPSFEDLPKDRFDAIVAYLASLRDESSCPDENDCG